MKTLTTRLFVALGLDGVHAGKSWGDRFTPEQHLRASNSLGSLQTSVVMGESDQKAVQPALLLLRGVDKIRWADR